MLSLSSFVSGECHKNTVKGLIQMWHVRVTGPNDVPYVKIMLNSHA